MPHSMSGILRSPIEALAGELGALVAKIERDLRQSVDVMLAELRAEVSAVRSRAAELELRAINAERSLADAVSARVLTIKDGEPGRSVTLEDVAPVIRAEVERVVASLPPAKDGNDADPELIRAMVDEAVAELPPAEKGEDADPEVIRGMVAAAVASLPPPEKGKDADPAVIRAMVDEAVAGAVSALPPPAKGDPGPPGRLAAVKAWTDGVHYDGDIVTLDGSTFQAIRDTGRQPPHDDWVCIAQAGRAGHDGRSFTIRGTWEPDGLYRELDVVAMNGASFVAKSDDPGPCPGDGWQLMSAQGKRGKAGEEGPKGNVGPKGPAVIGLGIDENGIQTLRNADGTTVSCDFYPLLSRLDR